MTPLILLLLQVFFLIQQLGNHHMVNGGNFELQLLVTRNIDGNFREQRVSDRLPCTIAQTNANDSDCRAGAMRLDAYVKSVRASSPNVLLFDVGAFYYGSPFDEVFQGNSSADVMRTIGYNASFPNLVTWNAPLNLLNRFITRSTVPFVITNVNVTTHSQMVVRYRIFTFPSNIKMALLGIMDTNIASQTKAPSSAVITNPNGLSAQEHVRLAMFEVWKVHRSIRHFVLIHSTSGNVKSSVQLVSDLPDIDAVIRTIDLETGEADIQTNLTLFNKKVAILNTYSFRAVNHFNITFDDSGAVLAAASKTVWLDHSRPRDMSIWNQFLQADATKVEAFTNAVIGKLSRVADNSRCSFSTGKNNMGDCPVGRLFAEATYAKCSTCDAVLLNSGSIRESIPAGNVTVNSILRLNPFDNSLVVLTLKGSTLLQMLEYPVSVSDPTKWGAFLQPYRLRYAFVDEQLAVNAPASRIVQISVYNRVTNEYENWRADKTYRIGVNDFMADGGDGFSMLPGNPASNDDVRIRQAVIDFLKQANTFTPASVDEISTACAKPLPIPLTGGDGASTCRVKEVTTAIQLDVRTACISPAAAAAKCRGDQSPRRGVLDLPFANSNKSECDLCSGVGTCNGIECVCLVPTTGVLAGRDVAKGSTCETLRSLHEFNTQEQSIVYAITFLTIVMCCVASGFYFYYRNTEIIMASSPMFLHLVNVGGVVACVGAILLVQSPNPYTCTSMATAVTVGATVTFGSLLFKAYRVTLVFSVDGEHVVSELRLVASLLGIVLIQCFVIMAGTASDPLDSRVVMDDGDFAYWTTCSSSATDYVFIPIGVINVAMVGGMFYFTWISRRVHETFNESRFVFFAVQNIILICVALLIYTIVTWDTNVYTRAFVLALSLNIMVMIVQGSLLVFKLLAIGEVDKRNMEIDERRGSVIGVREVSGYVPTRVYKKVANALEKIESDIRRMDKRSQLIKEDIVKLAGSSGSSIVFPQPPQAVFLERSRAHSRSRGPVSHLSEI